jgi:single-strand DNA-binding protein
MKSLRNSVQLIGRLGKDPEVKSYGDKKKAAFSIATTDSYKNQKGEKVEDTQWHNIVIMGKHAGEAEKLLKK